MQCFNIKFLSETLVRFREIVYIYKTITSIPSKIHRKGKSFHVSFFLSAVCGREGQRRELSG